MVLKLQVTNSPRASFIRTLLTHFLTPVSSSFTASDSAPTAGSLGTAGAGSLASFDWAHTRGADFRCFAQVALCLHAGPGVTSAGGSLPRLEKFLKEPEGFTKEFEEKMSGALRVLGEIAGDSAGLELGRVGNDAKDKSGGGGTKREEKDGTPKAVRDVFKFPTKVSPVEFVMINLLVGVHMAAAGIEISDKAGERDNEKREREKEARRQLAVGIWKMRTHVREEHVDIRMNDRVAKTMVEFVRGWKPEGAGASDGSGSGSHAAGKRKRKTDAEGAETETGTGAGEKRLKMMKKAGFAPLPTSTPVSTSTSKPTPTPTLTTPLPTPISRPPPDPRSHVQPPRPRPFPLPAANLRTAKPYAHAHSESQSPATVTPMPISMPMAMAMPISKPAPVPVSKSLPAPNSKPLPASTLKPLPVPAPTTKPISKSKPPMPLPMPLPTPSPALSPVTPYTSTSAMQSNAANAAARGGGGSRSGGSRAQDNGWPGARR
ncbi:hypothetical protein DXG03_009690 [Asterophora parasitica]|uniref:Uncharacterized protein n=1 Tax=Asterophora parasitica TaxID=117018 RepID=A0A9P7KCD3_9AGAR|nr:hypothetical protein DXG03_009690 [Asterophora parasitica]